MDAEVEFANRYGTPPDAMSWHRFLAYVERAGRFEVRELLRGMDATTLGQPMTDEAMAGRRQLFRQHLEQLARGDKRGV